MSDSQHKFQVDIVGQDQTANAFAGVEASFQKLGLDAKVLDAEFANLRKVVADDTMSQHFRDAEIQLRHLGLTGDAVTKEMAHLHSLSAGPPPSEFARAEEAFKALGLSGEQLKKQMEELEEISKHDVGAQRFRAAEEEIRALGLTSKAATEMVEGLQKAVQDAKLTGYDRVMNRLAGFGRHEEEGEHGGEGHENPGHGWDGISAHLNILRGHFGEFRENVGETRESLADMFPMLAGFGAIASAAGLVELIHSTAEEQAQLAAMSKQLGVTTDQLEAFHYAANIADVPVDVMDKSIAKLGITMQETVSGHDKLAAQMFAKMGIALRDAHGHLEPMTTILPEVAQALKNTADPQMRLFVATTLFGRAGRDMLPLLIQGREHLQDLTEEAEKLGPALTDLDRDHLEQFNDAWKQAQYVSESFMTKLGADLAPVMTPLLDDFTQFVAVNKAWIAQDAANAVQTTANAIKDFPWQPAIAGAKAFAGDIGAIATSINGLVQFIPGGWKTVIEGFVIYKAASPFAHMIADGMRLLKIGGELVMVVGEKLPAAVKLADTAWDAFGASGVAAFNAIKLASLAANEAFVSTPLGRAVSLSMAAADAASRLSQTRIPLTSKQEAIYQSFHLQAGQALTAAQRNALNSAGPSTDFGAGGGSGTFLSRAFDRLFGDDDAAAPTSPVPRGPFGRFGSSSGQDTASLPGGRDSTIHVQVSFDNAPANMTVTTTSSGGAQPSVDVGYNRLGAMSPGMPW